MKKITIIGWTFCLVIVSIISYQGTKVAFAHTESKQIVAQPTQNIAITIKSNNKNHQFATVNDVITLNYILKNKPSKNQVTLAKQSVIPVCSIISGLYNCSTAIKIKKTAPINDGVIPFSIVLDSGKSVFTATTDNSQVIVDRGFVNSISSLENPTLVSGIKDLSSINAALRANSKNTLSNDALRELLIKRKILMMSIMKNDPQKFLYSVLPIDIRKTIPRELQSEIESEVTEQGTLEVVHADNFDDETKSYFMYTLRQEEKGVPLYITESPLLVSGKKVQVTGYKLGDSIVVEKKNIVVSTSSLSRTSGTSLPPVVDDPTEDPDQPESVGDQKTLVFLVRFTDSPSVPFSKSAAQQLVFNGQFQKFYKEQSYNNVSFKGIVVDWTTLQQVTPEVTPYSTCNVASLYRPEIKNAIIQNGIQIGNYNRIVYLFQGLSGGCSGVGAEDHIINGMIYHYSESHIGLNNYNQSASGQPFAWTKLDFILSHELGHALGVMHANGWDCDGSNIILGNCQHIEYGNSFDTMGDSTSLSLHFNAFYKELLGWIKPENALIIKNSGTYTINPLESKVIGPSRKLMAKIKMLNSSLYPFYLEYRQPTGFDGKLNNSDIVTNTQGLFINKVTKTTDPLVSDSQAELLDISTTSGDDWWNDMRKSTLNGNTIFNDPSSGVSIGPIISRDAGKITFKVDIKSPICVRQIPGISLYDPYRGVIQRNSESSFGVSFQNKDTLLCQPANFSVQNIKLPTGWYVTRQYLPMRIDPQKEELFDFNFVVPSTAALGNYPFSLDAVNTDSGLKKTFSFSVTVTD